MKEFLISRALNLNSNINYYSPAVARLHELQMAATQKTKAAFSGPGNPFNVKPTMQPAQNPC